MSLLQQARSVAVTPRTVGISIGLFALLATGMIALAVKLSSGSSSAPAPHHPAPVLAAAAMTAQVANAAVTAEDYAVIVQRDLFRSPVMPAPPAAPAPAPAKIAPLPMISKPVHVNEPPPFQMHHETVNASTSAVAFTGVVEIAGTSYALLESLEDHTSQYVRKGGSAFGFTLLEIGNRAVTLESNGQTIVLGIGDNKDEEAPSRPQETPQNTTPGTNGAGPPFRMNPDGMPNDSNFRQYRRQRQPSMGEG